MTSPSERKLQQLLELIRVLDPSIVDRAIGADDAEIDELERNIGKQVLPAHRSFLRCFGNTPATTLNPFLYDSEFSIADVEAHYAGLTPFSRIRAPERWTFVMTIGAMRLPYFLDHQSGDPHDPLLGRPWLDEGGERWLDAHDVYCSSFHRELLDAAMAILLIGDYGYSGASGWLWGDAPQADPRWHSEVLTVIERMSSLGLELFISLDGLTYVLRAEDAFVSIGLDRFNESLAGYYAVAIYARDPKFAREVEEILADNFGFTR